MTYLCTQISSYNKNNNNMKKIFTLIVALAATMTTLATDYKFVGPSKFYVQSMAESTTVVTNKDTVKVNNLNVSQKTAEIVIPEMKYTIPGSTSSMTLASFTITNPTMEYENYVASFPEQDYSTSTVDASGATKNVEGKVSGTYGATTGILKLNVTILYGALKDMGMTIVYECTSYYTKTNSWNLPGVGNKANPFRILEAADFKSIADSISEANTGSGKYFQMMNDIDFGGTVESPVQLPAIGKSAITNINTVAWGFQGTFDGNGKTISGIYHTNNGNDTNGKFNALFSSLGEGGVVKNLTFSANNSISTYNYGAPFVSANKGGEVNNCVNNAPVTCANAFAAGICGYLVGGKGTVKDCTNNGDIKAMTYAAGICAGTQSGSSVGTKDADYVNYIVDNCTNNGNCSTTNGTGSAGIAASFSGVITNCTNNGTIDDASAGKTSGQNTAGIVACITYIGGVSGNTNTSTIKGVKSVAGIVGKIMKGSNEAFDISNNTNTGTIEASGDKGDILGASARDQQTTAINDINADVNATAVCKKAIVNGRLVIINNGKQYNAAGAQMK